MSQGPFNESVKVVDLLQRPFAALPMSSDLPRLTNIRVVDEHGRSDYEQPQSSAPTLVKLRYTFVALTALLLDKKAVDMVRETFDLHFTEGMDVSKLSMESFLVKIGGDRSPVVQVLKAVNQSAISPAIIHLKLKLGLQNMTKDVRDSWFYEIIVSASTGQVVVASHKRDQSITNEFQYEWVMAVHFDKLPNQEEKTEIESKSVDAQSTPAPAANAPGESSNLVESASSSESSTTRSKSIDAAPSGEDVATPRSETSSPAPGSPSQAAQSDSEPNKSSKQGHKHATAGMSKSFDSRPVSALANSGLRQSATSSASHDDHSENDSRSESEASYESTENQDGRRSSESKDKTATAESDASVEASDSPHRVPAESQSQNSSNTTNGATKSSESEATNLSSPTQSPRAAGEVYFEKRRFDFLYKCTNVSLAVTDLMFSLALHTTNQAKKDAISKILDPYATSDVMELSKTRNWEFFPASASTVVSSTSDSESASTTASSASSAASPLGKDVEPTFPVPTSARDSQTATIVQGVKEYENGDRYEGGLLRGIREGHGKYFSKIKASIYEGGYKDGKRHGHGKYSFPTGASVAGTFQRGILVQGEYRFPNGDLYVGDFKDDKFDGQGEWRSASFVKAQLSEEEPADTSSPDSVKRPSAAIDVYKGSWKAGKRHGPGEAKLRCGDVYTGEFLNDAIHGFGKYHFSNGDLYNGQFAQGLIHGVGEYTFASSGKVLLGEFANGKLVKSSAITNPTNSDNRKSKNTDPSDHAEAGGDVETEQNGSSARAAEPIPEDTEPVS